MLQVSGAERPETRQTSGDILRVSILAGREGRKQGRNVPLQIWVKEGQEESTETDQGDALTADYPSKACTIILFSSHDNGGGEGRLL